MIVLALQSFILLVALGSYLACVFTVYFCRNKLYAFLIGIPTTIIVTPLSILAFFGIARLSKIFCLEYESIIISLSDFSEFIAFSYLAFGMLNEFIHISIILFFLLYTSTFLIFHWLISKIKPTIRNRSSGVSIIQSIKQSDTKIKFYSILFILVSIPYFIPIFWMIYSSISECVF